MCDAHRWWEGNRDRGTGRELHSTGSLSICLQRLGLGEAGSQEHNLGVPSLLPPSQEQSWVLNPGYSNRECKCLARCLTTLDQIPALKILFELLCSYFYVLSYIIKVYFHHNQYCRKLCTLYYFPATYLWLYCQLLREGLGQMKHFLLNK